MYRIGEITHKTPLYLMSSLNNSLNEIPSEYNKDVRSFLLIFQTELRK